MRRLLQIWARQGGRDFYFGLAPIGVETVDSARAWAIERAADEAADALERTGTEQLPVSIVRVADLGVEGDAIPLAEQGGRAGKRGGR